MAMKIVTQANIKVSAYIDETGYSKTVAVEKAIRMFLDSQKADKNQIKSKKHPPLEI